MYHTTIRPQILLHLMPLFSNGRRNIGSVKNIWFFIYLNSYETTCISLRVIHRGLLLLEKNRILIQIFLAGPNPCMSSLIKLQNALKEWKQCRGLLGADGWVFTYSCRIHPRTDREHMHEQLSLLLLAPETNSQLSASMWVYLFWTLKCLMWSVMLAQ